MKNKLKEMAKLLVAVTIVAGYTACSKNSDDNVTTTGESRLKSSPLIISRDPVGTSKMYGITLGATPDTVDISGTSYTTSSTSYDMVFFSEKASTDCSASPTGCLRSYFAVIQQGFV